MKKIIAVILFIALLATTLTGCTTEELGLYNAIKSMKDLKNYTIKGTQVYNYIDACVPEGMTFDEMLEDESDAEQQLDYVDYNIHQIFITVDYSLNVDSDHNKVTLDLLINNTGDYGYKKIRNPIPIHISIDNSDNKSIIEVSPFIIDAICDIFDFNYSNDSEDEYYTFDTFALIDQLSEMEEEELDEKVNPYTAGTTEYTSYNEWYDLGYSDGYNDGSRDNILNYDAYNNGYYEGEDDANFNEKLNYLKTIGLVLLTGLTNLTKPSQDQIEIENDFTEFTDDLFNNFFDDLDFESIKQEGNKFSLDASLLDCFDTIESVVSYILENPEELRTVLLSFVNNLSDEQVSMLSLEQISKEQLAAIIADFELPAPEEFDVRKLRQSIEETNEQYDPKIGFTFERTADESYEITNCVTAEGYSTETHTHDDETEYCDYYALEFSGSAVVYGNDLTITADKNSVTPGKAQTFNASHKATWVLSGNENQNTAIDANGVLTVAATETAETLTLTATSVYDDSIVGEKTVSVDVINAATPEFTKNITGSSTYAKGTSAVDLTVSTTVSDGGVVTYQWFKSSTNSLNGTAIANANTPSYKPATSETGVSYYYVIATNTYANVNGDTTTEAASEIHKVVVNNIEINTDNTVSGAPAAELQGNNDDIQDAVLTDEDEEMLANGSNISVYLKVENTEVTQEEKAAIEDALGGSTVGVYIDISLFKNVDGAESAISETNEPVRITIDIPENLRDPNKQFVVVRVHNGVTTILQDLDSDPNTITIETNQFSTYAIAYANNPITGDHAPIILCSLIAMFALAIGGYTFKKRKSVLIND